MFVQSERKPTKPRLFSIFSHLFECPSHRVTLTCQGDLKPLLKLIEGVIFNMVIST